MSLETAARLKQAIDDSGPAIGGGVDFWFRRESELRIELQHVTFRHNGGFGQTSGSG